MSESRNRWVVVGLAVLVLSAAVARAEDFAAQACQNAIEKKLNADKGRNVQVVFGGTETFSTSGGQGIKGKAEFRNVDGKYVPIEYECVVDTAKQKVVSSRYRGEKGWQSEAPQRGDEFAVQACQNAVEGKISSDKGRKVPVSFDKPQTAARPGDEILVSGQGQFRREDGRKYAPLSYECVVNKAKGTVKTAKYREETKWESSQGNRGPDFSADVCQAEVQRKLSAAKERKVAVTWDKPAVTSGGNDVDQVRGTAQFQKQGGGYAPFDYECAVDRAKGKVTTAKFKEKK